MRRIKLAPEPHDFDQTVRQRGKAFLRRFAPNRDVNFLGREYWRDAIPQLRLAYDCVCSYTCHYVQLDVGGSSVEHFLPKSRHPELAYEWTNFRFVCTNLNARRGTKEIIDPFKVPANAVGINFVTMMLFVRHNGKSRQRLGDTIDALRLNDGKVLGARQNYVEEFAAGLTNLQFLHKHAPLIALEILRQKITVEGLQAMGYGTHLQS